MTAFNKMPCHITAGEDQFDNDTLLNERMDELAEIEIIADAIRNGDTFLLYNEHTVGFQTVVDDDLPCNPEFTNALRALINNDDEVKLAKAAADIRDIVGSFTTTLAESIFEGR